MCALGVVIVGCGTQHSSEQTSKNSQAFINGDLANEANGGMRGGSRRSRCSSAPSPAGARLFVHFDHDTAETCLIRATSNALRGVKWSSAH